MKNIFNKIRTAYLDDLENDPEVQGAIEQLDQNEAINRFVKLPYAVKNRRTWDPVVLDILPKGFRIDGYNFVPGNFTYNWGVLLNGHLIKKGKFEELVPEHSKDAFWDKKSQSVLFISDRDLARIEKEPVEYFAKLAALIDSGGEGQFYDF